MSQLCVFSKHLSGLPLDETARRLRAMNIKAVDLTVRPGGHVEPERAADDLLIASAILNREGVQIAMITTAITDASAPHTSAVLRAASEAGVGYYKLGYFSYAGFGTLRQHRQEVAARFADLAALNKEIGIKGGYHNHSHNFFGANLGDIAYALENVDPQWLGLYFDAAHAVIEGGSSGWIMGLDSLRDRTIMLAVKDFFWSNDGQGYAGGRRHKVVFCPLSDGNVPWVRVLECLKEMNFDGPISLHSEYQGHHSFRDLSTDEVFEQTARDMEFFTPLLKEAGLAFN
jgi:sugar phosphate isomerase/epimerase